MNHVNIIESQVFVYNLGTMYYIEDLLYPEIIESLKRDDEPTTNAEVTTVASTIETDRIPNDANIHLTADDDRQLNEEADDDEDIDGEVITPRALPVQQLK